MITNQICRDKAVHQLSDDLSRLAFTWLITFSDCEGRVFGDPAIIRATLFPRRDDISIDKMSACITEWASAGLVVWYECDNEQWIYFPKFEKNQPGLRKDREPESDIPEYRSDTCRIIAGRLPEEIPVKRREEKLREENGKEGDDNNRPNIYTLYEQNFGALTPMIAEELDQAEKDFPVEWIPLAFAESLKNNVRRWSYTRKILDNWKVNGLNASKNGKEFAGIHFDNMGAQ